MLILRRSFVVFNFMVVFLETKKERQKETRKEVIFLKFPDSFFIKTNKNVGYFIKKKYFTFDGQFLSFAE